MLTSYRQLIWTTIGAYVLLLTYVLVSPSPWWIAGLEESDTLVADPLISVAQHVAAYGLLGVLLSLAATSGSMLAWCVCLAAAHVIGTEVAQHFVPQRFFGWNDTAAGWTGLLLGAAIGSLLLKRFGTGRGTGTFCSEDSTK
jgi:VanZ family protein